jgi:hypothetical protein
MFTATNLMRTEACDHVSQLTDMHSNEMTVHDIDRILDDKLIPDLQDVPLDIVNKCLRFRYLSFICFYPTSDKVRFQFLALPTCQHR